MVKNQPTELQQRRDARLFRAALWVLRHTPMWLLVLKATFLSYMLCIIDRRHRRLMARQMRLALGNQLSDSQIARLTRACFRHEMLCIAEFAKIPRMDQSFIRKHVDVTDLSKLTDLKASGRGVLVITGHIGSWEMLAVSAALEEFKVTALAKPLKNPYIHKEVNRIRSLCGNDIVDKYNSLRAIGQLLRQGRWVCFLYDQNGGPEDAFVPFFGIPAATWRSAPFMHTRFDAPIVVASFSRLNWWATKYKINIHRIIDPSNYSKSSSILNNVNAEQFVLSQIHESFEQAIRAHPEQWLWQHRRWKTRPAGEKSHLIDGVPQFTEHF